MALPRLPGSPGAAAALPGAGPEGLAPFRRRPPALPFSSRPHPALRLAGRPGGTERSAPSSAALAAAARSVTLAAFAAIYSHTVGFHS